MATAEDGVYYSLGLGELHLDYSYIINFET